MSAQSTKQGPGAAPTAPGTDSIALPSPTTASYSDVAIVDNATAEAPSHNEDDEPEFIFEMFKGPRRGTVAAAIKSYRGHHFLDLRHWKMGPDGYYPTAKGVTVPLDRVAELGAALTNWAINAGYDTLA